MKTLLLWAVTDRDENGKVTNWRMETGFWHEGYEDGHDNSQAWNWGGRQVKIWEVSPTHYQALPAPPGEQ